MDYQRMLSFGRVVNKTVLGIPIGMEGTITAYLPERNIFAVFFDGDIGYGLTRWVTFNESKEWFHEHFDVELHQ